VKIPFVIAGFSVKKAISARAYERKMQNIHFFGQNSRIFPVENLAASLKGTA